MQQAQTQPKPTFLPPADPLGARFCQWFNHGWHWIHAETPAPGQKAQWFTENRYFLEQRNLWQKYQDSEKIIGLRFGNDETCYCLLDIDRSSPNHPANDRAQFKSVLAALEEIGLCRPLLVRSSDSEGIHIYYFLPEAAPTFALACAIRFALEDAGCHLRSGHLEVFPNTKAFSKHKPTDYNGHRLPLQNGSYWLDEDGLPISNDLRQFLDAADMAAAHQDMATLRSALAAAAKNRRRLRFIPGISRDAAEWKRDLEEIIAQGWTGHHQTNHLLKKIAEYGLVFLHLEGDALVDYVEATAKAASGYERWCRHQHEIRRRATDRSRGVDNGFYVKYCGFPKRDGRSYRENFEQPQNNIVKLENGANVSRRQRAAERIQQAMAHLQSTDTLPYGATARAAAIIATVKELSGMGMSLTTLHKPCHLSLWHPGQLKSPEPAQGAILHPVLETQLIEKSPEPAQGAILHPTPLYEGGGPDGGLPQPPQGEGALSPIQPHERRGESEGGLSPASVPAASEVSQDAAVAPAALAASEVWQDAAAAPIAPAASNLPQPAGASPRETWRLTGIRLEAMKRAKRVVKQQGLIEGQLFDPAERQCRETAAMMQFLWDSGDPVWMDEVKRWLAADPSRKLDLSVPTGAISASITHENVTETS